MDANTVGAVAALTGLSVRTLHHYDHVGLVVPSVRTPAGYRGYTDADIERLQRTIKAVEELMNARRKGIQLTAEEQVEIFGTTAFGEEYAAEAGQRWGERDAWKQSLQRFSSTASRTGLRPRPRATRARGAGAGQARWRQTRIR